MEGGGGPHRGTPRGAQHVCPAPAHHAIVHPGHPRGCGVVAPLAARRHVGLEATPRTLFPKRPFPTPLLVAAIGAQGPGGVWHLGAAPRADAGHVGTSGSQVGRPGREHPGHPPGGTRLAPTLGPKVRNCSTLVVRAHMVLLECPIASPCTRVMVQEVCGGWAVGAVARRWCGVPITVILCLVCVWAGWWAACRPPP